LSQADDAGRFRGTARGAAAEEPAPFEPMEVSILSLLMKRRGIQGWPSGTAMDSEDTLIFSAFSGVRPMIEKFPLAKVKEAYERMTSGHAEFRVVLTME